MRHGNALRHHREHRASGESEESQCESSALKKVFLEAQLMLIVI